VPDTRDDSHDRRLLGALASGSRDALAQLYDRHSGPLFRHAIALTRRQSEAEDLVQTVFVKLASTGAGLLGVRAPASYLHRMLKTTWLDGQRRRVVGERAMEREAASMTPAHAVGFDAAIDIERALDELPVLQREAVVLHLVEGLSFLEVGRRTGVSLFTAAARYRLAITRLRKRLIAAAKEPA
jgi:RNA polymerase sigma-70 factor (ECF subfamily)